MLTLNKQTKQYNFALPDCHNKLNECIHFSIQMANFPCSPKKNRSGTTIILGHSPRVEPSPRTTTNNHTTPYPNYSSRKLTDPSKRSSIPNSNINLEY